MNITEANNVGALLRFLLGHVQGPAAAEAAGRAAVALAGRAEKALHAGIRPAEVEAGWPALAAAASTQAPTSAARRAAAEQLLQRMPVAGAPEGAADAEIARLRGDGEAS